MTFVVGLTCIPGLILCSDSLEDDGITKKTVDKIRICAGTTAWGIAMAGSGPGSILDKFASAISLRLHRPVAFDRFFMESQIEDELANFCSKYVQGMDDAFSVIIAAYDHSSLQHFLYKAQCFPQQNPVLSPVNGECHAGMGNELWRFMADTLYQRNNSIEDNVRLAVFATRLAIKYAARVDGPIQVISHGFGDQFWRFYSHDEIQAIEKELPISGFQESIQDYWRLRNPPTHSAQLKKFGCWTSGGQHDLICLDGVKVEELATVSGRRRASKTFLRNTDKLQQHALQLKERYPAARLSASPPSDGKIRT